MANYKPTEQEFDFELLLTRYLDNDLDGEELAAFELQLQKNEKYRRIFVKTCRIAGTISDSIALRDKDFTSELPAPVETKSPILGFLAGYMPSLGGGFSGTLTLAVALIAVTLACFGLWGECLANRLARLSCNRDPSPKIPITRPSAWNRRDQYRNTIPCRQPD